MVVKEKLYQKNLSMAKKGLLWGLMGGLLYGISPMFQTLGMGTEPLSSGAVLGLCAIPMIVGCLQDFSSGIWVLIPNLKNGKGREYIRSVKTKPGRFILLASFFGGLIAMAGFTLGVYFAGPVYPVAISATFPAIGAVLSRIFLKEKISGRGWCGILLCVAGAITVSWAPPSGDTYPNFYLGIACAVLASVGWSLEGIISCAGMDFVDPEIALGIRQFASGTMFLFVLPFVASGVNLKAFGLLFSTLPTMAFVFIAIAGFGAGIGYFYYYKCNNVCGASRGMSLNIIYTLVSAVLSVVFLGSTITATFIIGIIVLLSGAVMVVGKPSELLSLRDIS